MQYVDFENQFDVKPGSSRPSNYVFKQERNFEEELQEYFMLKREVQKRKMLVMSGEAPPDQQGSTCRLIDPRQKTLAEKQKVNVRGPLIDETINCKICDLGNGCWTHYHFVPKIQTRQYRAPEVILGIDYDASTDLWSYACMVFELITGDFLFNPRPSENQYKKNDDHLALFMEMLGPMPKRLAMSGNMFDHYFDRNPRTGKYFFRRIHDFKPVDLERMLLYRYLLKPKEAKVLADFLMRILKWDPKDRPTAQQMLEHEWFTMEDDYNFKMTEMENKLFELKDQTQMLDNYLVDTNYIMEEKANLLGQTQGRRAPAGSYRDIDHIKAFKQRHHGLMHYKYPGELVDSDHDENGGDLEDNASAQLGGPLDSDSDCWSDNSGNSNFSFNSDKLIDGYKEFIILNR